MMGKQRVQFNKERRVAEGEPKADEAAPRKLSPAAQRALAEAQARREAAAAPADRPTEIGGPKGPEPTRYGDWEIKGRASDF
ncbi:MAG: DUF1674 domain-containing protein [Rhizobiaceae bacterium]|nr:DUF1674 domain-containing protein [Rhizobiaceae bacterium]